MSGLVELISALASVAPVPTTGAQADALVEAIADALTLGLVDRTGLVLVVPPSVGELLAPYAVDGVVRGLPLRTGLDGSLVQLRMGGEGTSLAAQGD